MASDIVWAKCILCQERQRGELLTCSKETKGWTDEQKMNVFENVCENFQKLQSNRIQLDKIKLPHQLTAKTMFENNALWHKSCRLQLSDSRVEKRIETYKKQNPQPSQSSEPSQAPKRSRENYIKERCIFCQSHAVEGLHQVQTIEFGTVHKEMAADMNNIIMSIRLGTGDLIASEAKYHNHCKTAFYNAYKKHNSSKVTDKANEEQFLEERAFLELVDSIKTDAANGIQLFPMAELTKLLNDRKKQFNLSSLTNVTRLKEKIITIFKGDLKEQGKEMGPKTLVFSDGLNTLVKDALKVREYDKDMQTIAQTAKIIREDMFKHEGYQFDGHFDDTCQLNAIPSTLKTLISMILYGTSLKDQDTKESQATLTAGQILLYNAKKGNAKMLGDQTKLRHNVEREPPLPVYLGLMIHRQTRSRKIMDILYHLGLSISYGRETQLEKQIASTTNGVVPQTLKKNTFTVFAVDNLDIKAGSTTADDELHGTFISAQQQPTIVSEDQPKFKLSSQGYKIALPDNYASIDTINSINTKTSPPAKQINGEYFDIDTEHEKEKKWAQHSHLMVFEDLQEEDRVSWAGYFAKNGVGTTIRPSVTGFFPIFEEKSASFPMLKHALKVVSEAIEKLNEGQVPVVACDQPLFAICKQIQWQNACYSEAKMVVMLGGLHSEMCFWTNLGKLLEKSGWDEALTEAEVFSSGRAQSVVHASHLK